MARSLVCKADGERPCNTCPACEKAERGIHPDIQTIAPLEDKREILVSAVRELVRDAPVLPNEAEHKVYILEADALNQHAQNAFLKLLEEPPRFASFLLHAENPLRLLPTVRSRCVHLSLAPEANQVATITEEVEALVDSFLEVFAVGGLDLARFCGALEKTERQILSAFIEACHLRLVEGMGCPTADRARLMGAAELFDSLRTDLRFNVSAGHISGKILATLI